VEFFSYMSIPAVSPIVADKLVYDSYITIPIESHMRKNVLYDLSTCTSTSGIPSLGLTDLEKKEFRLKRPSPAKYALCINMTAVPDDIDKLHVLCDSIAHQIPNSCMWDVSFNFRKTPDTVVYVSTPAIILSEEHTVQEIIAVSNT
jgi:hypothetical protein